MKTAKGKKKPSAAPKSKSQQLREIREKNAVAQEKAAKAGKTKGKSSKKEPASGSKQTALVHTINPSELQQLQHDAEAAERQLESDIPEYVAKGAKIYTLMEDVQKRELWKFAATPYKSWTAFVEHYAQLAKISSRTLFGVIGATKALPGISAEKKKEIGPRKLQKLAKVAKKIREKSGKPDAQPSPEIVEKAATQSVKEFDKTLHDEGLIDEPRPPAPQSGSMFDNMEVIHAPAPLPSMPTASFPAATAAAPALAPQSPTGDATVDRAIAVAIKVYDPQMTIEEALRFVCKMWLKSTCDLTEYEDMTNDATADELDRVSKKGGKKR